MSFRTLIIEDEEPARLRLSKLLQNYPDKIENIGFARNGEDGLEKINELKPDLIFLDIHMPTFSGFDLIQTLKDPPKIILTSSDRNFAIENPLPFVSQHSTTRGRRGRVLA